MKKNIITVACLLFFAQNHSYAMQYFYKWRIKRNLQPARRIFDTVNTDFLNIIKTAQQINKGENPFKLIKCTYNFYTDLRGVDNFLTNASFYINLYTKNVAEDYKMLREKELFMQQEIDTIRQQMIVYHKAIQQCKSKLETDQITKKLLCCKKSDDDSPPSDDSYMLGSVSACAASISSTTSSSCD